MLTRKIAVLGSLAVLALWVQTASRCQATVIFTPGNNPQPNEENILLNNGATGSTVFGVSNQSNIGVAFSSITDLLSEPASGQARIVAGDGLLNNITITVPGGSFGDLILNPLNGSGLSILTAVANEPGGGTATSTFTYNLGNGANFVTIIATGGETLASLTIDSTEGFQDLRQPRISDAELKVSVPEAGSSLVLAVIGMAALGVAGCCWRRGKTASVA